MPVFQINEKKKLLSYLNLPPLKKSSFNGVAEIIQYKSIANISFLIDINPDCTQFIICELCVLFSTFSCTLFVAILFYLTLLNGLGLQLIVSLWLASICHLSSLGADFVAVISFIFLLNFNFFYIFFFFFVHSHSSFTCVAIVLPLS